MAISSQLTLWCDHPNCYHWEYTEARTKTLARKEAKRNGWKCSEGVDICPGDHSKENPEHGALPLSG